ncbi:MAG: M48 family metalloprotease [Oligoflexia bacterium]|nr:M48 family metalloprotease [Oligoflexia bacterium]
MEGDHAIKGLAVLTAIPVVVFALWADYFGRRVARLRAEDPDFDVATELVKVKIVSLFALFFLLVIYLASNEARQDYPVLSNSLFFLAILLQWRLQASAEAKALPAPQLRPEDLRPPRPEEARPEAAQAPRKSVAETLPLALRAFAWSLFSGILYITILIFSLRASFYLSRVVNATPGWSLAFLALGCAVGVLGGLGLGFALGPMQLRRMFPVRRLEDEALRKDFESCFVDAGLPPPELWVIQLEQQQAGNALIAGFTHGRGPFRPGLFLTQATLSQLRREELRAIILHEISHLRLHHLKKRFVLSSGLILGSSVGAGFLVLVAHLLFPGGKLNFLVGAATVLLSLTYTFQLLARQSRYQEAEADIYAVRMGASIDDLVSALRKLDRMNGVGPRTTGGVAPGPNGHPSTEERTSIVRRYFEIHPEQLPRRAETPAPERSEKKAA